MQWRIRFNLALEPIAKYEVILYVLLRVQHANQMVFKGEFIFLRKLYVLWQSYLLKWSRHPTTQLYCSFLLLLLQLGLQWGGGVFELGDCFLEKLFDVHNQVVFSCVDFLALHPTDVDFTTNAVQHRLCLNVFELLKPLRHLGHGGLLKGQRLDLLCQTCLPFGNHRVQAPHPVKHPLLVHSQVSIFRTSFLPLLTVCLAHEVRPRQC